MWKAEETFTAQVDIANYSLESMDGKQICWQISDEMGKVYAEGIGRNISAALNRVEVAKRFELIVSIKDTPWRNRWNIWVYPEVVLPQDKQIIVTANTDEALKALKKGKKVLFSPKK